MHTGKSGRKMMAAVLSGVMLAVQVANARADIFEITSPTFKDNDLWPNKYAGVDPRRSPPCPGENISPPLAWRNAPDKTKSFVLMMYDIDAGNGLGSVHWVNYGIPPSRTSVAEGEGATPLKDAVAGKNSYGDDQYFGPCGPAGHTPHHYLITVIATDLEANALKPGLTRDEVIAALRGGHALDGSTIVGRYGRP